MSDEHPRRHHPPHRATVRRQVRLPTHWLRLRPAPEQRAEIAAFSLAVHAEPHFLNWVRDPFENHLGRLDFPEPIAGFGITLELIAELKPTNPFDFLAEPYAAAHPFEYPDQEKKELSPYLLTGAPGPRLSAWLAKVDRTSTTTIERLDAAQPDGSRSAHPQDRGSSGRGGSGEVSGAREGSCWDFAWLLTVTLRHLGLAARFACGYRVLLADEQHRRHAATSRTPVSLHTWSRGVHSGRRLGRARPFHGDLRQREPYSARVRSGAAARASDRRATLARRRPEKRSESLARAAFDAGARELAAHRYPVGGYRSGGPLPRQGPGAPGAEASARGEPVAGLGPGRRRGRVEHASRRSVEALARRVALDLAVEAAGARWACLSSDKGSGSEASLSRAGGSAATSARTASPCGEIPSASASGKRRAPRFPVRRERLAQSTRARAGRSIRHGVVAAHEDPLHELWRARATVPPTSPPRTISAIPCAGARSPSDLSSAHRTPTGYVLPLSWDHARACWVSGAWRFRRSGLYLAPGSASMGYRLPLDGLIDDEAGVFEAPIERSPLEERGTPPRLPRRRARASRARA